MKKILIILALILLTLVAWLALRHPLTIKPIIPTPVQTTNIGIATSFSNVPTSNTNSIVFVRPDYIDEEHWNKLMLTRQMILEQNQPVEFYARVVDQNEQPVERAILQVTLSRINEKMFATTNFFHMNMGDEIIHDTMRLVSDADGWFKLTGVVGKAVWIDNLEKEGYEVKKYEGGVAYEPHGVRTPISDVLMTNAWDSQKGYILHLQKIDGK